MDTFAFDLAETAHAMRREFDRRAAALGVTRPQWRVLARLARRDGVRQIELADALDLEPITLSRMIDRLAEAELVERRPDESDRRAWNVWLTPKARPLIDKLWTIGSAFLADALEDISDEDRRTTERVLAGIRNNLSKSGGEAARKAS
jgi:MarR family transcriptional regulator, transcriptional regulator for hemolysin